MQHILVNCRLHHGGCSTCLASRPSLAPICFIKCRPTGSSGIYAPNTLMPGIHAQHPFVWPQPLYHLSLWKAEDWHLLGPYKEHYKSLGSYWDGVKENVVSISEGIFVHNTESPHHAWYSIFLMAAFGEPAFREVLESLLSESILLESVCLFPEDDMVEAMVDGMEWIYT